MLTKFYENSIVPAFVYYILLLIAVFVVIFMFDVVIGWSVVLITLGILLLYYSSQIYRKEVSNNE